MNFFCEIMSVEKKISKRLEGKQVITFHYACPLGSRSELPYDTFYKYYMLYRMAWSIVTPRNTLDGGGVEVDNDF